MRSRALPLLALLCGACAVEATPDPTTGAPPAGGTVDPATPVLVPEIGEERLAPPEPAACATRDQVPVQPDDLPSAPVRAPGTIEKKGGLDKLALLPDLDRVVVNPAALALPQILVPLNLDSDGDCLSDADEARLGTDPHNPDTDGDGWYDGPCNARYKLYVQKITALRVQGGWGDDELYLVADDVRHPQRDLDDHWTFSNGSVLSTHWLIATRTRGVNMPNLAPVALEGWEDDFEVTNTWTVDDLLWKTSIDLGGYKNGDTFTRRYSDGDADYELVFRVEIEKFADPEPRANGDSDHDGISEASEGRVARAFGGITDPQRPDVLVEVDWMPGHALRTEAKREVVTQYYRNGIHLFILRDHQIPLDGCLSVPEARALYATQFGTKGYGAFRYAVIGEQIWNDASGVTWGDMFLVDDSTWWINNWVLPQAGTFIHELGHTMGLTKGMFRLIDTIGWPGYDSAMNYFWQATKVDYSYDGAGGQTNDHDDWGAVDPAYGLRYSFGLTTSTEKGICK